MTGPEPQTQEEMRNLVKQKCLNLLTISDRSEYQLRERLKRYGFPECHVEEALSWVKSLHYLDDRRFAQNYILGHMADKGMARLRMELRKKGISDSDIEDAFEGLTYEEEESALSFAEKLARKNDLSDPAAYRKALQKMARRGFSYGMCVECLRQAADENG